MSMHKASWWFCCIASASAPALATNHVVIVGQNSSGTTATAYNPPTLSINVNDTVTFTNVGGGLHNVHSDGASVTSFQCSDDCAANSAPSANNWSSVVTFPTAGAITYHCDFHGIAVMAGSISVNATSPVRLQSFEVD